MLAMTISKAGASPAWPAVTRRARGRARLRSASGGRPLSSAAVPPVSPAAPHHRPQRPPPLLLRFSPHHLARPRPCSLRPPHRTRAAHRPCPARPPGPPRYRFPRPSVRRSALQALAPRARHYPQGRTDGGPEGSSGVPRVPDFPESGNDLGPALRGLLHRGLGRRDHPPRARVRCCRREWKGVRPDAPDGRENGTEPRDPGRTGDGVPGRPRPGTPPGHLPAEGPPRDLHHPTPRSSPPGLHQHAHRHPARFAPSWTPPTDRHPPPTGDGANRAGDDARAVPGDGPELRKQPESLDGRENRPEPRDPGRNGDGARGGSRRAPAG